MEPDVIVQSISFRPDGVIEIQYSEGQDQSDNVALIKVLMIQANALESQVNELLSDIIDLIDAGLDKLRNPPMTRPSGLGR